MRTRRQPIAVGLLALAMIAALLEVIAQETIPVAEYVHFYLLRQDISWESIPILATQLLAREDPFPHVALETSTGDLMDVECTLCLWNIAVSRPAVEEICKGGNWTRGTNPQRIKEIWKAFRDVNPDFERARGYPSRKFHSQPVWTQWMPASL